MRMCVMRMCVCFNGASLETNIGVHVQSMH